MNILKEMIKPKLYRNPLHIGCLRNKPCVCGSGKKIKQCHGQKYAIPHEEAKAISELIVSNNRKPENLREV
jgi:uncharacterized protein YecA (UPF0149 family)